MTNPAISVIIPTYNRAGLIMKAINSILSQTFQDFEILIIDDASTDNTREVIDNLGNPKIRYYKLDKNSGQCIARNYGIKRASGQYIGFLDSDDEWLPEKLSSQMECFQKGPSNLGAVYGFSYSRNAISNQTSFIGDNYFRGNLYDQFIGGFCPPTPSLFLVKKEALDKVNYFDENLITFVDLDLWIRISKEYLFDFVEKPLIIKNEQIGDQYVNNFEKRHKGFKLFMNKWQQEIIVKKGKAGLKKLKKHIIYTLVVPILSYPPRNIRHFTSKIILLLISVQSLRWRLYAKAIKVTILGPELSAKLKKE